MVKPLIPALRSALPGQSKILHDVSSGFLPDRLGLLHLQHEVGGHAAGSAVLVVGECLSRETPDSPAYALVAYVAPSATQRIAYTERRAAHFEVGQHTERWFAGRPMYFTEIDITDYADYLRLEYLTPAVELAPAAEQPAQPLHLTQPAASRLRHAA